MNLRQWAAVVAMIFASLSSAYAKTPAAVDTGDTAWILTASALVLMMTIPGLGLFYGGLVRMRNVLSVNQYMSGFRRIETLDQRNDSRFSAARRANECCGRVGFSNQAESFKHGVIFAITETHI